MPEPARIALVALACVAFLSGLIALVRRAKTPGKGVHAVGMAMMLFGWGNMRDPGNDTVAEARDGRVSKGEESGMPPDRS